MSKNYVWYEDHRQGNYLNILLGVSIKLILIELDSIHIDDDH